MLVANDPPSRTRCRLPWRRASALALAVCLLIGGCGVAPAGAAPDPGPGPGPIPGPGEPPQGPKLPPLSGYIPPECARWVGQGKLVDCWLGAHPRVAAQISFVFPNRTGDAVSYKGWSEWSAARRQVLRQAYLDAKAWWESGRTSFPGTLVADPAPNQNIPWIDQTGFTVLSWNDAWKLYVAHVGMSLATELHAHVPWTIRHLDDASLQDLFGFGAMFWQTYTSAYVVYRGIAPKDGVPSNPVTVRNFLADNALIGSTATSTIAKVLDWSRWNMSHVIGSGSWSNLQHVYQYVGMWPISRVISGTVATNGSGTTYGFSHWTMGCGGTTGFLAWVLRTVNVPVRRAPYDDEVGSHSLPYFPSVKRYLSHGDDPYGALSKTPKIKASQLLISEKLFEQWFLDPPPSVAATRVGRRPRELAIKNPPPVLVSYYCQDLLAGSTHATGKVYEVYADDYSVAEIEAKGLWTRLEPLAAASTDWPCDQLP